MKFKEGDLVKAKRGRQGAALEQDKIYEVKGFGKAKSRRLNSNYLRLKGVPIAISPERLEKLKPINNKLNRKLYPSYREYKGYLVPADFEEEN